MRIFCAIALVFFFRGACSQAYNSSSIFAHNDYVRPQPFYTAFNLKVGYIEADVYLVGNSLLVAHQRNEIRQDKTLEALYLDPLLQQVKKNGGSAYPGGGDLTLMVDLKTEGEPTLTKLVQLLQRYPELLSCPTLHFMVSGNVPSPARWEDYPEFITFDGRPGIAYSTEQLKRVAMISTSFRDHAKWDGRHDISADELEKIQSLMAQVHAKGKKMRFWATPDFPAAWQTQMRLNFDVIVTDDVTGLAGFIAAGK
jgi:alkaline phosphatase